MGRRVTRGLLLTVCLAVCFAVPSSGLHMAAKGQQPQEAAVPPQAQATAIPQVRRERALLIGMDEFVSKPNTYPSSTNNVYAMQATFQGAKTPLEVLLIPDTPIVDAEGLTRQIHRAFGEAQEGDVSYLYISTHGVYDPVSGEEPALLLSDGQREGRITAAQLEAALQGIAGTKVLLLDACNSGAFIGKGMPTQPQQLHFQGDGFKVITSSGALEESWYWSADGLEEGQGLLSESGFSLPEGKEEEPKGVAKAEEGTQPPTAAIPSPTPSKTPQGAFYFTQALSQGLSARCGYPADSNQDGRVTLTELYEYLLQNHAASTPQVYPQLDDFSLFAYDTGTPALDSSQRSPIVDVSFSGAILDSASPQVTVEYVATRPVRVAYQVVYQQNGKWQFDQAQLLYDNTERFTAFGDQRGAVSAGRKVRTLSLDRGEGASYGYMMVQLVSMERGRLTVHAGQVLCVPPTQGQMELSVRVPDRFQPKGGGELCILVEHSYPCTLSVTLEDEEGNLVLRLCHRRSTRPVQMEPAGTLLYWDGRGRDGEPVSPGRYRIQATAYMNQEAFTQWSEVFVVE